MSDTRYLDWPFFNPHHAQLARDLDQWASEHISQTHSHDVDAECKALVKSLGRAGWLKYAIAGSAHGAASEVMDTRSICVIRETLGDDAAIEAETKRRAELLADSRQTAGAPARTARGAMAPDDANNRGDAPTYSAPAPAVTVEGQAALDFMREAFGEEAARLPKAAPPEALRGMSAEEVARKAEALKALRARLGGTDRPAVGAPIRQSPEEIRDRQVYEKWVAAKRSVGDSAGLVSFDSLRQSMARQADALREKHPGKEVGFDVVVKDGKAYLKPIPKP